MKALVPPRFPGPSIGLSLFGVVAGCLAAVLLVPDKIDVPEDLRWAGLAFSIGMLSGPLVMAWQRPESVLHPVSILLLGVFYWLLLDLVQAMYVPEVSDIRSVRLAFLAVGLFAGGICLGAAFRFGPLPGIIMKTVQKRISPGLLFHLGLIAFLLAFLRFAIPADFNPVRMYEALFTNRWAAPWARGALGGWDSFLDHLTYFGYILPALTVLLYRMERRLTWRPILLGLMALVIVLLVAQGGGRRIIGALVASAGVVWVLTSRVKGRAILTAGLVGVPALLTYLQFVLVTRGSGLAGVEGVAPSELVAGGFSVDDNFNRLSQLVEIIPTSAPHVGFEWLYLILVRPIPRALWSGKPEGLSFSLPDFLGYQNVSLTASVVGESYLAFGFLGCLLVGIFYGALGRWLSLLLQYRTHPSGIILFALGLLALFVGIRATVEIVLFSYAILAWIVLAYFIRRARPHYRARPS